MQPMQADRPTHGESLDALTQPCYPIPDCRHSSFRTRRSSMAPSAGLKLPDLGRRGQEWRRVVLPHARFPNRRDDPRPGPSSTAVPPPPLPNSNSIPSEKSVPQTTTAQLCLSNFPPRRSVPWLGSRLIACHRPWSWPPSPYPPSRIRATKKSWPMHRTQPQAAPATTPSLPLSASHGPSLSLRTKHSPDARMMPYACIIDPFGQPRVRAARPDHGTSCVCDFVCRFVMLAPSAVLGLPGACHSLLRPCRLRACVHEMMWVWRVDMSSLSVRNAVCCTKSIVSLPRHCLVMPVGFKLSYLLLSSFLPSIQRMLACPAAS